MCGRHYACDLPAERYPPAYQPPTYDTIPSGYCGRRTAAAADASAAAYAYTVRLFFFYTGGARTAAGMSTHTPRSRVFVDGYTQAEPRMKRIISIIA